MEKIKKKKKIGFALETPEAAKKRMDKSLATRRTKKAKKDLAKKEAASIREEATELRKRADKLDHEADLIDGKNSSSLSQKKYEEKLSEEITETYKGSVSTQYLKQMISHAIRNRMAVDAIVTPTHAAMDILNHPNSTSQEKERAINILQKFESAKPAATEDNKSSVVGNVQEEMNKLRNKHSELGPKRHD